jgi:hypothetical protein
LRASLYGFLDKCVIIDSEGRPQAFKPNKSRVANVLDALQAVTNLSSTIAAPAWLGQVPDLDPHDIIACQNGLLHLPTLNLLQHSPLFFAHNALDFAYDAAAPRPAQWINFLCELWPNDPESIETLQEIFGPFLTTDTRQQKAFCSSGRNDPAKARWPACWSLWLADAMQYRRPLRALANALGWSRSSESWSRSSTTRVSARKPISTP